MRVSQKITHARENVASYIPELKNIINMITFRETGVISGGDELPAMYLMGPTIHYISSKVDELSPAQVCHWVASLAYMVDYVYQNEKAIEDRDRQINMVAMSIAAATFLEDYPEHSFQEAPGSMKVNREPARGKSVEEIYKMLKKDPSVFGEDVDKYVTGYLEELRAQDEQDAMEAEQEDQEKLKPWLDNS